MHEVARTQALNPELYAKFADESFTWQFMEQPAFDRYLTDLYLPQTTVLDIGCGTGRVINHLVERGLSPENIVGLEPSKDLIKYARQCQPGAQFVRGDATHLPFHNEQFDLITANMVIHYLGREALLAFLDQAYDALKPNGVLFIVGVDHAHSQAAIDNARSWMAQRTPWGEEVAVFNHNIDDLVLDDAYYAGLDMWYGNLLQVNEEGKMNPASRRYENRFSRFAARFHKVSSEEKQRRYETKDQPIPPLS